MKSKDFDQSINDMDATATELLERLHNTDPASEEYARIAANLKSVQESKQIEVRNKSEHLSGMIPAWATGAVGMLLSLGIFQKVFKEEKYGGGVFSGQAVNLWDKIVRKFGW